jgi:hypothetical protein
MFQTTRFSRPMLKSGRLLTIALLALAPASARQPFPVRLAAMCQTGGQPREMVVTLPLCIREPATGHILSNRP